MGTVYYSMTCGNCKGVIQFNSAEHPDLTDIFRRLGRVFCETCGAVTGGYQKLSEFRKGKKQSE